MGQGKKGIPVVTRLTAAEVAAGVGNNVAGGFIEVIDANEQPTGQIYVSGPVGSPPAAIGAGAAGTELAWAAATTVQGGEIRRATVAVGTIGIGDRMASNSARTTGATFDAAEASNWTELPEDPDVVLKASVVNTLVSTATDAPLSAAQGKALQDGKANKAGDTFTGDVTVKKTVAGVGSTVKLENDNYALADKNELVFEHGSTQNAQGKIRSNLPGSNNVDMECLTTTGSVLNTTPAWKAKGSNNRVELAGDPTVALEAVTKQYADGLVAGLLDYRGAFTPAVASGATGYPTTGGSGTSGAIMKGDAYAASAAGFILTEAIQSGDWVIAKQDTPAQTAANWDRLNANISYVAEDAANKVTALSGGSTDTQYPSAKLVFDQLVLKQATLVSGTNIKTINSQSLVGSGDLAVGASSASVTTRDGGTGGTVTQVGNDRVHTFLTSDNFVVPAGVTSVRILAVGGGGGGGAGRYPLDSGRPGGGGGAGRYLYNAAFTVTPGASISVVVGAGGAGATDVDDSDAGTGGLVGGNSTFSTLTALGGGGGGGHHRTNSSPWDVPADQGGSGGGGSNGSVGASANATNGGLGNAGGNGVSGTNAAGGGGGGSGGTGGNGNSTTGAAGPGGIGTANNIRADINVTYATGGAGSHSQNAGHIGAAAAANTGNGGEGSYQGGTSGGNGVTPAGNGGSGIVIVRYIYQSLDTPIYANNAAAIAGGLTLGMLYRTGADPDTLCVVH